MTSFEIHARYKGDDFPVLLRTDDRDRAKHMATVLRGNARCAEVFIVIGNKQISYEEFINQLENSK